MEEYIINGVIITEPISTSSLEAGVYWLLNKENKYLIVNLLYLDTNGNWHVETDNNIEIVSNVKKFYKLSILTKENTYSIAFSDWKKIIKNNLIGKSVTVAIIPYKFREGKSVQTCTECTSSFIAARSQPFCKNCCNEMSTAVLKNNIIPSINKRPRLVSKNIVKDICMETYDMLANHCLRRHEYEEWLNKKLEDVNNND